MCKIRMQIRILTPYLAVRLLLQVKCESCGKRAQHGYVNDYKDGLPPCRTDRPKRPTKTTVDSTIQFDERDIVVSFN